MATEVVINAVTALAEAFGRTATAATVGAYEIGLQGLTPSQIRSATGLALQRCKFMPVPSELRELAMSNGQSFEAMAERAFDTLRRGVKATGPDYSVCFADGAINAVVRLLGGWQRVCNMPVEEFDKWLRKDFVASYVNVCRNGCSPESLGYLGGNLERLNARYVGEIMRSGKPYSLEHFGAGVKMLGSDYQPALPAPVVERKKIGASREFMRLGSDQRMENSADAGQEMATDGSQDSSPAVTNALPCPAETGERTPTPDQQSVGNVPKRSQIEPRTTPNRQ